MAKMRECSLCGTKFTRGVDFIGKISSCFCLDCLDLIRNKKYAEIERHSEVNKLEIIWSKDANG